MTFFDGGRDYNDGQVRGKEGFAVTVVYADLLFLLNLTANYLLLLAAGPGRGKGRR